MKISTDQDDCELLRERLSATAISSRRTFLTLTAAAAAIDRPFDAAGSGRALAAVDRSPLRRLGRRRAGGDRQTTPSSPTRRRPASRSSQGTFGDENEIITKIKTSKPGDLPDRPLVRRQLLQSNTSMAATTRRSTRPTSPTWPTCCTAMIEPFRKITPKLSAVPYDYGTTGIAYNTKVISPDEAKEKGANLLIDKKYAGKIGGYADMTTRVWYARAADRPGPERHQGHGCGLGQGPRDPRPRQEILELRRRADGSPVQGRDRRHRRLVGPRCRPAAAGSRRSAISIPPGSYAWMEDMLVLKGSPMAECEELINFMLDPATVDRRRRRPELSALARSDARSS